MLDALTYVYAAPAAAIPVGRPGSSGDAAPALDPGWDFVPAAPAADAFAPPVPLARAPRGAGSEGMLTKMLRLQVEC